MQPLKTAIDCVTIHTALTPIIASVFERALVQQKAHTDMWFRAAEVFVESPRARASLHQM